jgi:DNA polymerase-3 subunit chi
MASNLPRVDFYVHSSSTFEPLAATACRLTDKAWQQKASRRMVIRVDDTHQATLLDELLWTFRDGAFLPHARLTDATDPAAYPILIAGSDQALPSSHRDPTAS